ncbi:kinesin light chain-like protein [Candidatus Rhodobacter oscarellae]|uniref:Kinesin light chain-like protein n=1 Tax=Candidatus Rhodobacter oscarellae TaxID=1675527 RepID=A0A0J9E7M0_9RHOB|nr:toll/interleukin-1 receptor domain-containing protein [Candidatus Rhodobacter lobularis]KMW58755.1 kinesin light chain-like protein [Candidatus Rhodobacter lobularis]
MPDQAQRDFFISFTIDDLEVATVLNDALNAAGFSTYFHPKDIPSGGHIAYWMETGLDLARQLIAVCSTKYFAEEKVYSHAERLAKFWQDPLNANPLIVPVQIEDCTFPSLMGPLKRIDLRGKQAPEMGAALVAALQEDGAKQARLQAGGLTLDKRRPEFWNVEGQPNPLFTGRDTEMADLHERIRAGGATAITAVAGMGGVGKTTLAREYALRHGNRARFGGVWWIPAETAPGVINAYDTLAEKLPDIDRQKDSRENAIAVRDWLGQQPSALPWLVIFDNAPNAKTVKDWLPQGSAKVIVTSRFRHFENVAEMMPLDIWDEDTTTEYLLRRVERGTKTQARSLAKRLEGLPLAAEQAGAYLREHGDWDFAEYEAHLVDLLAHEYDNLTVPVTVMATFSAAIEAVAKRPHGAAALAILNICAFLSPDGVDVELLKATASESDILPDPPSSALSDKLAASEAFRALTAFALMRYGEESPAGPVLVMHRLIGEVARARLSEEEAETWRDAAIMMIRRLMPYQVDDPGTWPLCARLVPHAEALKSHTPGPGQFGVALDYVLNQAALFLNARGDFDGAIDLLRRSVALSEELHKDNAKELATALGNLAGHLQEREETWDEAEATYLRALKIKEEILVPSDPSLAITLSNLGNLHRRRKNFAKAVELTERATEIDKVALGEISTNYAIDLSNLGAIYYDWGNESGDPVHRKKEVEYTEKSAEITRALRGTRHPEVTARLNNLAVMYANQGDMARAAEDMAKAVAIDLSLDQLRHPETQRHIAELLHLWTASGQKYKAQRLASGDGSDIVPYVEQIEAEHRSWVAEDPENRDFGPPSPVTGATK